MISTNCAAAPRAASCLATPIEWLWLSGSDQALQQALALASPHLTATPLALHDADEVLDAGEWLLVNFVDRQRRCCRPHRGTSGGTRHC